MGAAENRYGQQTDLDLFFNSSSYDINQPFLQIFQEGYRITSVDKKETFNAVRKRNFLKVIMARICALIGSIIVIAGISFAAHKVLGEAAATPEFAASLGLILLLSFIASYLFIVKKVAPKRVTSIFQGDHDDERNKVFEIMPSSGVFLFNKKFSLIFKGKTKLYFKRPFIHSLFRIKWEVYDQNENLLFTAHEDSWAMSILRRYFRLARFIPMHFILKDKNEKIFCNFNRKFSIKDKYKIKTLQNSFQPWMTLATCILLDTAEER